MTPLHQISILVIEDDEPVRQTLVDMLEVNGFSVVAASNGIDGLALARRALPSLIITDVNMPGMTGFELLETFRGDETLRSIPVIVVSAKVDRAATRRGMELGAADFITKPFTEEEVLHSIATRLEKKELMDELDAFSHTVAHDLKSPIATLTGRLEILGMLLETAEKTTLRHQLDEATKSAFRLVSIIDELLVLAGVRRQAVRCVPLDMAAIVAESLDGLDHLLKAQKAKVQTPPTWPVAIGHAPWIMQVWVNYLSNAAKYGGTPPQITLGADASPEGAGVRFWVKDEGPGLDAAGRQQMFVPFTRISSVRAKGHGLGLSIVRRIVEKLGGQVGVDSEPGQGARFWFELPVASRPVTVPLFRP
jgi:two-component system sensor histidine kinase/response regulator